MLVSLRLETPRPGVRQVARRRRRPERHAGMARRRTGVRRGCQRRQRQRPRGPPRRSSPALTTETRPLSVRRNTWTARTKITRRAVTSEPGMRRSCMGHPALDPKTTWQAEQRSTRAASLPQRRRALEHTLRSQRMHRRQRRRAHPGKGLRRLTCLSNDEGRRKKSAIRRKDERERPASETSDQRSNIQTLDRGAPSDSRACLAHARSTTRRSPLLALVSKPQTHTGRDTGPTLREASGGHNNNSRGSFWNKRGTRPNVTAMV